MPAYRSSKGRLLTTFQPILRADSQIVVVAMMLCNTDTSNRTFQIQHVPADDDTSDDHALFHDTQIRSKVTQIIETPIFMEAGDSIQALASVTDKIAMNIYSQDYESYLRAYR